MMTISEKKQTQAFIIHFIKRITQQSQSYVSGEEKENQCSYSLLAHDNHDIKLAFAVYCKSSTQHFETYTHE